MSQEGGCELGGFDRVFAPQFHRCLGIAREFVTKEVNNPNDSFGTLDCQFCHVDEVDPEI